MYDNGRITEKKETLGDSTAAAYAYDYDGVGRLLTVTKAGEGVAESCQYKTLPYGISTYDERNSVGRSLSCNDEDNLLTAEAGDTLLNY